MTLREPIQHWQKSASDTLTDAQNKMRMTVHDAARIAAFIETYAARTQDHIIAELLSAALSELEYRLAYMYIKARRPKTWTSSAIQFTKVWLHRHMRNSFANV